MPAPQRLVHEGRTVITRAELSRLLGIERQSLYNLYQDRERNGHPEHVHRAGNLLYFDEQEMLTWARAQKDQQKSTLTEVDRSGDPDELIGAPAAARVLGYRNARTITSYLYKNPGYFPDPDEETALPAGGVRRRWKRRTLWEFADRRSKPGRAGHPGPS